MPPLRQRDRRTDPAPDARYGAVRRVLLHEHRRQQGGRRVRVGDAGQHRDDRRDRDHLALPHCDGDVETENSETGARLEVDEI